jgi:hypothetical protein
MLFRTVAPFRHLAKYETLSLSPVRLSNAKIVIRVAKEAKEVAAVVELSGFMSS